MKTTGIIRRIDELGRIVIPKDIRKKLEIKTSDSLELLVSNDCLVCKKYSIIADSVELSQNVVDSFFDVYRKSLIITDREKVVVANTEIENYQASIQKLIGKVNDRVELLFNDGEISYYLLPLIINGDVIGSIILVDNDISEVEKCVLKLIKTILIKNIEE